MKDEETLVCTDVSSRKDLLEQAVQSCFYMGISPDQFAKQEQRQQQICRKFGLDRNQLNSMLLNQSEKWTERIEKAENLLEASDYVTNFAAKMRRKNKCSASMEKTLCQLMAVYLCLVLQNVSSRLQENHLKKKDVRMLLDLLDNPRHLKRVSKRLNKPLIEAARKETRPYSPDYLTQILVRIQLLSDYYLAALLGKNSQCVMIQELISLTDTLDQQDIYRLLPGQL